MIAGFVMMFGHNLLKFIANVVNRIFRRELWLPVLRLAKMSRRWYYLPSCSRAPAHLTATGYGPRR